MAHLGKTYPYLFERWLVEVQFWPGWVPRKLYVRTTGTNGDSWDLLAGGLVSDDAEPDFGGVDGDLRYPFTDPLGQFFLNVRFHQVAISPKKYSVSMRMGTHAHANICSCEIGPEERTFGGYLWTLNSGASPPYFNGHSPTTIVRGATWSEV